MDNKIYLKWIYDFDVEEATFDTFEQFTIFMMHNNKGMNILEMGMGDFRLKYDDSF